MGLYKNLKTGEAEFVFTYDDVRRYVDKFKESPEAKKIFAEVAAERKKFVQYVLEEAQRVQK